MTQSPTPPTAEGLPIVAWRYRWTAQPGEPADVNPWQATAGPLIHAGSNDVEPLTPQAPAQAQLDSLRSALAALHADQARDAARPVLNFRPASEAPKVKRLRILGARSGYLVLNPCDGFHILWAHFVDDGEFTGFREFGGTEDIGPDFYVAWAELPDTLSPELRAFSDAAMATPVDAVGKEKQ